MIDKDKQRWLDAKMTVREDVDTNGIARLTLGEYYTNELFHDVKHLTMSWSRYKFISKLFRFDMDYSLLELGCNEGMGALFFSQGHQISRYLGVDFDTSAIEWAKEHLKKENISFIEDNFLNKSYGKFDAVVSVDVIEHLSDEAAFMKTICENLSENGVAVIGTPNITMTPYASEASKRDHINLYDQKRLWNLGKEYFHNVFLFNMNDEVVHTGFDPMSCYMFALCVNPKVK
jgi:2-polyprenyl-3-methyl-5-hydroxy-6-metoxy-1,4-benzoquinol methylase